MKHLTVLLALLLMPTIGLFAAKKGQAPAQPAAVSVSCSTCISGSPITISVQGFAQGNATMYVVGPYTAVTLISVDSSGHFSMTYPTGLHFPAGSYQVSITQAGVVATTSFNIQ